MAAQSGRSRKSWEAEAEAEAEAELVVTLERAGLLEELGDLSINPEEEAGHSVTLT